MSHGIVTAAMVATLILIALGHGWNITIKHWIDDKINAAKPA